ncbi:hypothetical protein MHU86_20845 [Fragilaria crotonensis]|nr:hypothetical protein MHU86_20845 [Fragilaria crotonensis]
MGGVEGEVFVPAHFQQTAMVVQSTNHQQQQHPTTMQPMMHSCHPPQYEAQQHQYPYQQPLQPQYQLQSPYPQQQYPHHQVNPYQQNQFHSQQPFQQHPTMVVQSTGAPHQPQPIIVVADPNMMYSVQPIYMHPPMMNTSLQPQMPQQQYPSSNSNPVKDSCINTTTATTANANNMTTGTTSATSHTNATASSGSPPAATAAASGTGTSKPSSGPFDCLDDIATHMNTINSHQTSLYSSFMKVKTSFLALTKGFGTIMSSCSKA